MTVTYLIAAHSHLALARERSAGHSGSLRTPLPVCHDYVSGVPGVYPHATDWWSDSHLLADVAYRLQFALCLLPDLCVGIEGSLDAASECGSVHRASVM